MDDLPIFTYQTRIDLQPSGNAVLDAYAELYGKVERTLFAATQAGSKATDLKHAYQVRFGLTARQFNAVRVGLEGKVRSIEELRPRQIAEAEVRIRKAEKVVARLEKTQPKSS